MSQIFALKQSAPASAIESKAVKLKTRIIFLKLGTVDTKSERYDADVFIECCWEADSIFKLLVNKNTLKVPNSPENRRSTPEPTEESSQMSAQETLMVDLKNLLRNVKSFEYKSDKYWNPQLFIENAIGDLKEDVKHKLDIVEKSQPNAVINDLALYAQNNSLSDLTIRVTEMRKAHGLFYERLELYDFPMDTQELSITLTSNRSAEEVEFQQNDLESSGVNTQEFHNQQEWMLYEHVNLKENTSFDQWRKFDRNEFIVTCYITRKPGYYLYNAYMMVFLITVLGFVPFAFNPAQPNFRCQVTGLLLLTSVNFRWIVTQRLPSVAYLTSLDKYAIGNLFCLVLFCVWHSLIGSDVITSSEDNKKTIDTYILYIAAVVYSIFNLLFIGWFLKMYYAILQFKKKSQLAVKRSNKVKEQRLAKKRIHSVRIEENDEESRQYPLSSDIMRYITKKTSHKNEQNAVNCNQNQQSVHPDPALIFANSFI